MTDFGTVDVNVDAGDLPDALRCLAERVERDARRETPVSTRGIESRLKHGTLGIPASVDRDELPSGYVSYLEFDEDGVADVGDPIEFEVDPLDLLPSRFYDEDGELVFERTDIGGNDD